MFVLDSFCPVCENRVEFKSKSLWHRDHLVCPSCPGGSLPRDRAIALVLSEVAPNWKGMSIHESSAADSGFSWKLSNHANAYTGSRYIPGHAFGVVIDGYRNENLESLTFGDESFDITVTLDVMEHVYHPDHAFREVYRTLKPGGVYICTFPVRKGQVAAWERRFEYLDNGTRLDIREPEFHGSPVDGEDAIVTIDWGYDLHQQISAWAPFDVRVHRFSDRTHGIIGEYTDVIVCRKPRGVIVSTAPALPASFDEDAYLRLNPDVAEAGFSGAQHWLEYGRFERRRWRG